MRDVYDAIGRPGLMAMGNRTEAPGCLVEQAVNAALDTSFQDAEALLLARFGEVTLAALAADFHARMAARSTSPTPRSDERRVGKEWCNTGRARWAPEPFK